MTIVFRLFLVLPFDRGRYAAILSEQPRRMMFPLHKRFVETSVERRNGNDDDNFNNKRNQHLLQAMTQLMKRYVLYHLNSLKWKH